MIDPLDLIDFGADISKVRSEIDENIKLLKLRKTYVSIYKKIILSDEVDLKNIPFMKKDPKKAVAYLQFFSSSFFMPVLESIKTTPYKIHPLYVIAIEALYYISNQDKLTLLLSEENQLIAYYRKLVIEYNRYGYSNWDKILELSLSEEDHEEDTAFIEKQTDGNDKSFNFLFAFTLRQIPLQEIDVFLNSQKAVFPTDKNFNSFLELTLVDYKKLIPKKTRKVTSKWLTKKAETKISDVKNQKINAPIKDVIEERSFAETPEGWTKIPGKLKYSQIIDYLSIFKQEANDCSSGQPFFTKETFDTLMNYGLAYPIVEPKKKPINFNRTNRKTNGMIFYIIFKLYEKNKPLFPSVDYKMHYAKFIKHNIGGIDTSLQSILDNMNNKKPAKLPQELADKYIYKLY